MQKNIFQKIAYTFEYGYRTILEGLGNTLLIACVAVIIGIIIGTLIAIIKTVKENTKHKFFMKLLDRISTIYVGFFRGTPMVVQLLLFFFVIFAQLGVDPLLVAIVMFGLNSGAYVSEIMRSGILSVDHGQLEAGRSLGLSYSATMRKIVLPQAIKNAVPNLCNEFISLVKETSIAGFITVIDVTRAMQIIAGSTYETMGPYFSLAVIYLVIVTLATYGVKKLEKRLRKSDIR